jgi:hypothetical protein
MEAYLKNLNESDKIEAYLDTLDIIIDCEDNKFERMDIKLHPEKEPRTPQTLEESHICRKCFQEMRVDETESQCICINCGFVKPILVFRQDYKDITYERTGYLYKRITHFRKHVRDLWNKIPKDVRLADYIERLELMFNSIQSPFLKWKPKTRRNFFNYQYVLIKFFEIMKLPDLRKHLKYLKSQDKLKSHDDIWSKICLDLKWEFIPSQRITPHKRIYKKKKNKKKQNDLKNKK